MNPPSDSNIKSTFNGHATELMTLIERPDHKFLSPELIAKELNLSPDLIRAFFEDNKDIVRRADVRDQNGNNLYARASDPITLIERWGRLYSYINKEPLPSYRPDN